MAPGLTSYAVAAQLGKKFSILVYLEEHRLFYAKSLQLSGLHERCASIRAANLLPDYESLVDEASSDASEGLAAAAQVALEEDHADVLIMGSTTMHPIHPHLVKRFDVPIIDPGPLALKMAEVLVDLGLKHSRRAFAAPVTVADEVWHALPSLKEDLAK